MATITEELLILIKSVGGLVTAGELDKVTASTAASGRAAKVATSEHLGFKSALGSLKSIAFQVGGLAGIGGLALGVHEAIKNAQEMQVATTQLGQAIKNNVRFPAEDAREEMTKFAESLAVKGGFNPVDAISSMTRLLFVTKDTAKAQKDMSLASDIARGAHVSLQQATRAVSMVEAGRTTGLSRMGIFLEQSHKAQDALTQSSGKHTLAQREAAKAQDENASRVIGLTTLWQKYGHTTDSYSHTAAGAISNLKNTVEILTEQLGSKLLPIVGKVAGGMADFVRQMQDGKGFGGQVVSTVKDLATTVEDVYNWLKPLWPVVAGLAVAWAAWNVALAITAGYAWIVGFIEDLSIALEAVRAGQVGVALAQLGLNAAFLASPWFWVIAAIAALVGAFLLLWDHSKAFRDFWKGVWKAVKAAVKDAVDWIENAWHNTTQWISNAASNTAHWVTNAFHNIISWFKSNWPTLLVILTGPFGLGVKWIIDHWKQIKQLPSEIIKAFKSAADDLVNAITWPFRTAFKWVKAHLPTFHTHHIGPIPIPLPSFPGLAAGGVTPYGGAFVVGERGPELVTLPQGASVSSQDDLKQTNQLLRELIVAVQQNSQVMMVDGKVLAQSVMRQGLLQASRS